MRQLRQCAPSRDECTWSASMNADNGDVALSKCAAPCHFVPPCGRGVGHVQARSVHTRLHIRGTRLLPARLLSPAALRRRALPSSTLPCIPLGERVPAWLLPLQCLSLHCCPPLHSLLLLALPKQKLRGRLEISWAVPLARLFASCEHEAALFYTGHQMPIELRPRVPRWVEVLRRYYS